MNSSTLQIFLEYKVKQAKIEEYEAVMRDVIEKLKELTVEKMEWFVSTEQPHLYVEMFQVLNAAHYHAIKKMRKNVEHPVFGKLDDYIEGGLEKLNCWAFQTQLMEQR